MRRRLADFMFATLCVAGACKPSGTRDTSIAQTSPGVPASVTAPAPSASAGVVPGPGFMHVMRLRNRVAYIPPQCFTKTRGDDGKPKNPCYACHTRSEAPNFVNDEDLQVTLALPEQAWKNPWTNLLAPPVEHAPATSDEAMLEYVRQSNYFDAAGHIALAHSLEKPPAEWDANSNGRWDGFTPDVRFAFDEQGFDHGPDGVPNGWRAFAYYPFVGTFFPTNGSADDVLIRLDPALREDAGGHFDTRIYVVNLAIVEALITRADVAIEPIDEAALGVDLDLDGRLGRATRVAFDAAPDGGSGTRMQY